MTPKSTNTARDLIEKLRREIAEHDYYYFVLDKPKITDFAYDQLFSELRELEAKHPELVTPDSPTQRVTGLTLDQFEKVRHRRPMLSLQNSYSPEEILEFHGRVLKFLDTSRSIDYFCEPKLDGLAIELIYEEGQLTAALTRGDGEVGENVLHNIRTIRSIPLKLKAAKPPRLLEVRGEVLMMKEDFRLLNEQQQEDGQATFANPRNAAAGTVRQLDSSIAASRPLRMFCYALGESDELKLKSQSDMLDYFAELGLPTLKHCGFEQLKLGSSHATLSVGQALAATCQNEVDAVAYYQMIDSNRHRLPFDVHAVVVKVNSLSLQQTLGQIARSPRWATAAKFKPEQAQTVVEDIVVQVGRTGALTPVAIMKPVRVGGVTVTNATLHNQDEVDRKDIRIGDTVVVHRAGDVIPEIVSVVLDRRPRTAKKFQVPSRCPICGEAAHRTEGEVITRCTNSFCPAILNESLKHFVSRRAMNVDRLGDKIIEQLTAADLVRGFSDLYALTEKQILGLERQGEKSAGNIIESIEKSKKCSLAKFLYALGIRFVGEQTARELAKHFGTLTAVLNASEEDFLSVPDIGPKVARSLYSTLKKKRLRHEIDRLLELGVQIEGAARSAGSPQSQLLAGKIFVITGTLPKPRDEVKDLIESLGGTSSSSVSKKTNFVLAGDDPGSKLEKARELNVPVIDWGEFEKMLKK